MQSEIVISNNHYATFNLVLHGSGRVETYTVISDVEYKRYENCMLLL